MVKSQMHHPRSLAALAIFVALLLFAPAAAVRAESHTLHAVKLATSLGRTDTRPLSVLTVADQTPGDDNPARYKLFDAGARGYTGTFTFRLPAGVAAADLTALRLDANYRGPAGGAAAWRWELRDYAAKRWIMLGDSSAAGQSWSALSFDAGGPPARFVRNGELRLRYRTSGSADSRLDYLALVATVDDPPPTDVWQPAPGTTWQWQLQGEIDPSYDVDMYDIDLFDTPHSLIDELHADGRVVICYFSAGSWENWRPDAAGFPAAVKGRSNGWPGEKWLDIRRLDILGPIMAARLDLAAAKGCDGVEPDNIDAYTNNTGFPLTYAHQLTYNRWLADEAHARDLSIGLKNDLEQIGDLLPYFDWAINEQCYQYDECELLDPFVAAGKAVFGVEYSGNPATFCPPLNARDFSWLKLPLELDGSFRIDCQTDYP